MATTPATEPDTKDSTTAGAAPRRRGPARLLRSYVVRRIGKALLTIFLVATATFFLVRLLPGSPVEVYINQQIAQYGVPYEQAAAQAASLFSFDPAEPLWQQYLDYLAGMATLDFGTSLLSPGTPVISIIAAKLPWTILTVGLGLIISFVVGIVLGQFMAYRRGGAADHTLTATGSILGSIPNYLFAIILVFWVGIKFDLVDIGQMRGAMSPGVAPELSLDFLSDILYHASMPILTYVLTSVGAWMLLMKASTTETLGEDYVTVARARGLPERRIRTAYVGRNAVLPMFSYLAVHMGFVVGGAILVEKIFQYDGVGYELYKAVQFRDYPMMQGILLMITTSVILANLAADLLYSRLDPRIRLVKEAGP